MITDLITKHIAKNNLEEAFLIINDFLEETDNCLKEVTLLKQQFSAIEEKERKGTERNEEISIVKNQIIEQLINLVSHIDTFINPNKDSVETAPNNDATTLKEIAQEAILTKNLKITSELHKDRSCVYYKTEKVNSGIDNDFHVVQLLNQYQLNHTKTKIDKAARSFFYKCKSSPFVAIQEIIDENPSYIIRDYIKGITLDNLILNGMKLSLARSNKIIITLVEGLRDLHRKELPYKKLIPSQIVVAPNGNTKILPMNIFLTNQEMVTWTQLKNSVKFMSPEELKQIGKKGPRKPLKRSSNQYSLGLILFYILTGEPLYDGVGIRELCQDRLDEKQNKKQKTNFRSAVEQRLLQHGIPQKKVKSLGLKFNKIFTKLLEEEIENRFNGMDELWNEINQFNFKIQEYIEEQKGKYLPIIYQSFQNSVFSNDSLMDVLHNKLYELIPQIEEEQDKEYRNTRLYYALDYLFNSISNLNDPQHLKEATSCLIKEGANYTIQDYDLFFKVLKDLISENDIDWDDSKNEAWDYFNDVILTSIEKHYFQVP